MELPPTSWAVAPNFHSLAEMAIRVNETLCRDRLPNRFVSLVYLELESNSDRVRLLNAGQLPPIHLGAREMEIMPQGSLVLGLLLNSLFHEPRIALPSGDI